MYFSFLFISILLVYLYLSYAIGCIATVPTCTKLLSSLFLLLFISFVMTFQFIVTKVDFIDAECSFEVFESESSLKLFLLSFIRKNNTKISSSDLKHLCNVAISLDETNDITQPGYRIVSISSGSIISRSGSIVKHDDNIVGDYEDDDYILSRYLQSRRLY